MNRVKASHETAATSAISSLARYVPPMLFAFGLRSTTSVLRRVPQRRVNTVTTNVPGPQVPLYALGREMLEYLPFYRSPRAYPSEPRSSPTTGRSASALPGTPRPCPRLAWFCTRIEAGISELSQRVHGIAHVSVPRASRIPRSAWRDARSTSAERVLAIATRGDRLPRPIGRRRVSARDSRAGVAQTPAPTPRVCAIGARSMSTGRYARTCAPRSHDRLDQTSLNVLRAQGRTEAAHQPRLEVAELAGLEELARRRVRCRGDDRIVRFGVNAHVRRPWSRHRRRIDAMEPSGSVESRGPACGCSW